MNIIAMGNLLYNEELLAQSNIGAVIAMKLNCSYDGLRIIPFMPILESITASVWKKEQMFPQVASTFIKFSKKYLSGIGRDNL